MLQKKQDLQTKFLKSETIYKRRVSTTTQRELPIPSIAVKVSVVQDDIFGAAWHFQRKDDIYRSLASFYLFSILHSNYHLWQIISVMLSAKAQASHPLYPCFTIVLQTCVTLDIGGVLMWLDWAGFPTTHTHSLIEALAGPLEDIYNEEC